MNVEKLYSRAEKQFKAKNYDETLKILEKVKRLDPKNKKAIYLEMITYKTLDNTVKEYYILEKILLMLDFSSPEKKDLSARLLFRIGKVSAELALLSKSKEFFSLIIRTFPNLEYLEQVFIND